MIPKYAVFKLDDVYKYAPFSGVEYLRRLFDNIELGRLLDHKAMNNQYLVINRDEPYADEVIEIMKRHGHWEDDK